MERGDSAFANEWYMTHSDILCMLVKNGVILLDWSTATMPSRRYRQNPGPIGYYTGKGTHVHKWSPDRHEP